jgi:hypothetical protein
MVLRRRDIVNRRQKAGIAPGLSFSFPGCCAARSGALLIRGPSAWVPDLRSGTRAPHRVRDTIADYFASARLGGEAGHDLISVS